MDLTKLNTDTLNFIDYLIGNLRSKQEYSSIAMGKAIADSLSLPASRLEVIAPGSTIGEPTINSTIAVEFNSNHKMAAVSIVSELNEVVPINIEQVLDYTCKFYMGRYYTVYPEGMILSDGTRPVYDFFNISMGISPEAIKIIEDNYGDICRIYRAMVKFINLSKELNDIANTPKMVN